MGCISQIILANTVYSKKNALGVFSNLLKQINAKIGLDLYRLSLPNLNKTMIIGTNYANSGGKCHFGFSSSYTSHLTQHFTKVTIHDLPKRETNEKERLSKEEKEIIISETRTKIMVDNILEALKKH